MKAAEALDKIRAKLDELDDLLDAAAPVLPGHVRAFVPIVDGLRKIVDAIDDSVSKKGKAPAA